MHKRVREGEDVTALELYRQIQGAREEGGKERRRKEGGSEGGRCEGGRRAGDVQKVREPER